MALHDLTLLSKVVEDRVAKTTLQSAILLQQLYLAGRMKTKSNTSIDWDVLVDDGGVAIEPVTQDGANTAIGNVVPANLRIGRYRVKHQFMVNRVDIKEAAARSPQDIADLFTNHVDRGITKITRETNRLLYEGTGNAASGEVVGLNYIVDNANAYAGIASAANPTWSSINLTNGTVRALTKQLLLKLDETVSINETSYNMIVMHPTVATRYNVLFDQLGGGFVMVTADATAPKKVELGHGQRVFNGTPIFEDPMCPADRIYFLNANDIDLFSFLLSDNPSPASQVEQKISNASVFGLNLHVAELPSNNSAVRKFELYVLPQLRLYNRKSLQCLNNIDPAL